MISACFERATVQTCFARILPDFFFSNAADPRFAVKSNANYNNNSDQAKSEKALIFDAAKNKASDRRANYSTSPKARAKKPSRSTKRNQKKNSPGSGIEFETPTQEYAHQVLTTPSGPINQHTGDMHEFAEELLLPETNYPENPGQDKFTKAFDIDELASTDPLQFLEKYYYSEVRKFAAREDVRFKGEQYLDIPTQLSSSSSSSSSSSTESKKEAAAGFSPNPSSNPASYLSSVYIPQHVEDRFFQMERSGSVHLDLVPPNVPGLGKSLLSDVVEKFEQYQALVRESPKLISRLVERLKKNEIPEDALKLELKNFSDRRKAALKELNEARALRFMVQLTNRQVDRGNESKKKDFWHRTSGFPAQKFFVSVFKKLRLMTYLPLGYKSIK